MQQKPRIGRAKVAQYVTERRGDMYRTFITNEGMPCRIYRDESDILSDILNLKVKVEHMRSRLNIRSVLLEKLSDDELSDRKNLIPRLEAALSEAEELSAELKCAEEGIQLLKDELYESRCARGG